MQSDIHCRAVKFPTGVCKSASVSYCVPCVSFTKTTHVCRIVYGCICACGCPSSWCLSRASRCLVRTHSTPFLLSTALCTTMVAQRLLLFDVIHRNDEEDAFMTLAFRSDGSRLLQDHIEVVSATTLLQWQRVCLEHALMLTKHRHGTFAVSKFIQESSPWFHAAWSWIRARLGLHQRNMVSRQRNSLGKNERG